MRRRWPRILLWTFTSLVVLGVGGVWFTPDIIRWYVHDNYAGIVLKGEVGVNWTNMEVLLEDVSVDRPGIAGELSSVVVRKDKTVYVSGGQLNLDLDKLSQQSTGEKGGSQGATIYASGLAVSIRKGKVEAEVKKASINPAQVCFDSGTAKYRGFEAKVTSGCLKRDKSEFRAVQVDVPVRLPFDVPRIERDQTVTIAGLKVDLIDKVVRFDSAGLRAFTAKGPATVKLDGETVFFDTARVDVNHPWVAPHPVHFNRVSITAPLDLLKGKAEGKLRITIDRATVRIDPINWTVDGDESCNDWITALPHPLPEALVQAKNNFTGKLSFDVRAKPTPHLEINYDCQFKCSVDPIKSIKRGKVTYLAYDSKNELFERQVGYQTPNWVSIADLPSYVPEAFRLMEDPGFHAHHGIHIMALVNSLKANLEKGRFVKGGSTITMQLAKNLWLRRHKTIGRKAQEALLTIALESCMGKARIMELYMNVVEYAPDVYGLRAATQHYFRKDPSGLSADEAFYLASILPSPRTAVHPKYGGMARVKRLMGRLAYVGAISEFLVPVDEEEVDTTGWEAIE